MTKSGITKRWLLTTILVIAVILLLIDTGIIFFLKNYYYSTVERKLQSLGQSSAVADFFSSYIGASSDVFSSRANGRRTILPCEKLSIYIYQFLRD